MKRARLVKMLRSILLVMKKARLVVMLLSILLVTIALLRLCFRNAAQGTIAFEVAKSLLQLGVVAVVGAFVSWAMTEYQLAQSRYEYREELLTSTLSRAVAAYSRAKRARRLLRARSGAAPGGPGLIRLDDYDRFMEMVNDAQLELESLKGDVKTSEPAFASADSVFCFFKSMEEYLGKVVKEYEMTRHTIPDSNSSVQVRQLEALSDFLGPANASLFKREVIDPYHKVQDFIRKDLLHPKLPR